MGHGMNMSLDSALRHPPKCRHASPRARRAHRVRLRQLFAELLADLGHQASVAERIALEAVSAATVRARRLRLQGRDDSGQMRPHHTHVAGDGIAEGPAKQSGTAALDAYLQARQATQAQSGDAVGEASP